MKELNHNNNKNDCPNKELTKAILYIEELEKQNKILKAQLNKQRQEREQDVKRLKNELRLKDSLLSECEVEIGKIKNQYEMIESTERKRKYYQNSKESYVSPVHTLIKHIPHC